MFSGLKLSLSAISHFNNECKVEVRVMRFLYEG